MNNIPKWVKKFKTEGMEIRNFGNHYYAYVISSTYGRVTKRDQKRRLGIILALSPRLES